MHRINKKKGKIEKRIKFLDLTLAHAHLTEHVGAYNALSGIELNENLTQE